MNNKEIAELTTRIVGAAVSNSNVSFKIDSISLAYEQIYKTIKKMDQESQPTSE